MAVEVDELLLGKLMRLAVHLKLRISPCLRLHVVNILFNIDQHNGTLVWLREVTMLLVGITVTVTVVIECAVSGVIVTSEEGNGYRFGADKWGV